MDEGNAAPLAKWDIGSTIYSVALSHDGTSIACGTSDNHVRIWDLRTGALVLQPLVGHRDSVHSVAFCPSRSRIVSGSDDHTIRIWSTCTGTQIGQALKGHTDRVHSVAFSSDSTRIVSGSEDRTVRIWDSDTGILIGEPLEGHTNYVYSVAFSHDSSRIVSGSFDKTIRIWDVQTGAQIGGTLRGHNHLVTSVAFSYDNTRIVSGSWDETVRIWDACTGAMIGKPLEGHTDFVNSVAFSLDNARIVSGSRDKSIRIWDARSGAPIGEPLTGHAMSVRSVVFSPDSSRIISGSRDFTVCVWKAPQSTRSYGRTDTSFDMVTSKMSAQVIFDCLVKHGCTDLSSSIDPARYSKSAIASGGFGDVWQAWLRNETLVAVKCLRLQLILNGDKKGMKRMARELHHWSKARHDNIQELLGITMFQDRLAMVSLWMSNGNLQQYIEINPGVNRYLLCIQVSKGVAYLHRIGMVHGDLKAANILVSGEGVVKISDFDHSILLEGTLRFSETSMIGGGTTRWMAPELLLHEDDENDDGRYDDKESKSPVTRNMQTDVYALGMTMLETISGKVPYHQFKMDGGVIHALIHRQPPKRPQELSGPNQQATRMWALLLTCWDHDPLARPNAYTVLKSLQSLAT